MYPCLDFAQCSCEADKIAIAYQIFYQDFIQSQCLLNKILIDSKTRHKLRVENLQIEEICWHIISRKNKNSRYFDEERAKRIQWIRHIINDYNKPHIKIFYFYESDGRIRLYLWLYQHDFVVILEKITTKNDTAFIVTSFYIDNDKKRQTFEKKYTDYVNQVDLKLRSCEWF